MEFGESQARVEILGMGSQAKIPGMESKRDGLQQNPTKKQRADIR